MGGSVLIEPSTSKGALIPIVYGKNPKSEISFIFKQFSWLLSHRPLFEFLVSFRTAFTFNLKIEKIYLNSILQKFPFDGWECSHRTKVVKGASIPIVYGKNPKSIISFIFNPFPWLLSHSRIFQIFILIFQRNLRWIWKMRKNVKIYST